MDTKTDFNLNNIIATVSLISISSVKKFAGKCPDTYSNLISTPLEAGEYRRSELRGLDVAISALPLVRCKTIDPFSTTSSESQESYLTTGMLPYKHSSFFSAYARLYNAAASPASRLPSAGSLAINKPWDIQIPDWHASMRKKPTCSFFHSTKEMLAFRCSPQVVTCHSIASILTSRLLNNNWYSFPFSCYVSQRLVLLVYKNIRRLGGVLLWNDFRLEITITKGASLSVF